MYVQDGIVLFHPAYLIGDFSLLSAGVFFRRRILRCEIINHQLCWWSTILALAVYVFAPKYRRQIVYGNIREDVGRILGILCKRKGVEIIEAECCIDHIHMFVRIPPNLSISSFMGYLKGKSSLMIFDRHANLKYKYGNRKFWCRGYYVDTVGKNAKKIEEYIKNQLQDDQAYDQLSLKEYIDPFTGEPVIKGK